ncbi:MAG: three-Cys-motif partner protein TcmP [Clostridiales bacterium]|jgi:three-Cys-motif partner protein|nr:three-Cys-motif partner protein TcmP [Clostridiales bacterium]
MSNEFFQEQREQSLIKARIVSKYFSAWASVILATQKRYPQHVQRMAYIDIFAEPGRYDDQSKSTPLLVLETIHANPDLASRMVTLFNDKDAEKLKA